MPIGELLRPGIFVIEEAATPAIEGVGVATGGFVGQAKKGPTYEARLIVSWPKFQELYGGFYQDFYLPKAVKAFFDNGGRRCYIARAVGTGAAQSEKTFKDQMGNDTLKIYAQNEGLWGNSIAITTEKFSTTTSASVTRPDISATPGLKDQLVTFPVNSVDGFELGDIVYITDGTNIIRAIIISIDRATKELGCLVVVWTDWTDNLALGASVKTSSRHLLTSTIKADLADGATSIELTSVSGLRIGSLLLFAGEDTDTANKYYLAEAIVTGIAGNTVSFSSISVRGQEDPTIAQTIKSGSLVASLEFNLIVKEEQIVRETHEFLSMIEQNEENFIEKRLGKVVDTVARPDDSNQSMFIIGKDLLSTSVKEWQKFPLAVVDEVLSGGADGAEPGKAGPGANTYLGDPTPGSKSGMYLFDDLTDINFFSIPGIPGSSTSTAEVAQGASDYAEKRQDIVFVAEGYKEHELPEEIRDWTLRVFNRQSSYTAIYYPWIKQAHPLQARQIIESPPSGWIQGVWAARAQERGIHVAPANVPLKGLVGLTYNITDSEHDILNPLGINVIRAYPGLGIRPMGARTLSNVKDGRHFVPIRNWLNFIKRSIASSLLPLTFEPITHSLFISIETLIKDFLRGEWAKGALFGATEKDAFSVKCDEETTPPSVQAQGRVICEIIINPARPSEQIVFLISIATGSVAIKEA